MRVVKHLLLALILAVIVVLAIANRDPVTLRLLPAGLAGGAQRTLELPLWLFSLAAILLGLALGYLFEWARERRHRRRAARMTREAEALEHELGRIRRETGRDEDDVLALVRT